MVWRLRRYILLVAVDGETMRLRRYTGFAGDRVACGDYMLFLFCLAGGFGACGATYCLWRLGGYERTMRLRRYTWWARDRVACGDYMLFLFCHPDGLAPAALHIAGEHNSVLFEDFLGSVGWLYPHQSRPLLVGLTTMASSTTTAGVLGWRGLVRALHAAPLPRPGGFNIVVINNM